LKPIKNIYRYGWLYAALTLCIACFDIKAGNAQVLPDLQKKFNAFQKDNLQEKIYVHINKNFYLAGELLWFKVYCTNGADNKLLDISKVAYVELLDNHSAAVMQAKIALVNGTGNGSLVIPFSLNSGNYLLRVYTNRMKNFDAAHFFERQVSVVNPLKSAATIADVQNPHVDVQFFPEGGQLVRGLDSRIACKVTGPGGRGLPATGAVIDQQNDTVARFKTLKFGMGSFIFKPASNQVYRAITKVNGGVIITDLPVISESGYAMQATDGGQGWNISVKNADNTSADEVFLVAHTNHTVEMVQSARLSSGSANFSINKNILADGISYFTLFDSQSRAVCERMVFKRPATRLVVNAAAGEKVYGTRKKASIAISTSARDGKSVPANLSLSVYRADELQEAEPDDIDSYLLLRAGLKGYIESAGYYLENNDAEATEALDNLMLSQGWTQFDWSKVLQGKNEPLKFIPEYTGPIITGHVTNTVNNSAGAGVTAYLTIPGTPAQLYAAKSDSAGQLLFNTRRFYGPKEIIVQTNSQQDSTYHIEIENPYSTQRSNTVIAPFALSDNITNALADNSLNMQVQNIFAADQLKQFKATNTDSTIFYGAPTKSYLLDDYTRFPTMEEVLREYVGSIAVVKHQGKFGIKAFNVDKLLGSPLILLDGAPVFDADKIFKIDPLKVKKLEVVSTNYLYGPALFNGIMNFTTYKGDGTSLQIDPRAVVLDYDGLQLERKFYTPAYDSDVQLNSPKPDFRSALYWNPDVSTPNDGKIDLSFYTGDKTGRYIGVIEGIAPGGETGSARFYFEVKK